MAEPTPELPHYREARELAERAPTPARVDNVLFGTAGWTDPSLLKSHTFYPSGASRPEARLRFYAQHFSLVEVDATYYALLDPQLATRWADWTPAGFVFNVKAHASVTGHAVELARLPAALREETPAELLAKGRAYPKDLPGALVEQMWQRFEALLRPLSEANRLGSVLLQFPPWFTSTRGNARHLQELAARFEPWPIAVEFRHPSWLSTERRDRVFGLLSELRWSYVVVDEPVAHGGGVPAVFRVTRPDLVVFRLHGHNTAGWRRGSSVAERFNYLYQPAELSKWRAPLREVAQRASQVHVIFNNCVRDFAVVGAKDLAAILSGAELESRSETEAPGA